MNYLTSKQVKLPPGGFFVAHFFNDRRDDERNLMHSDANLPLNPVGYYLLLEERRAIQKTAGGIILAPETQDAQQYLTQIGKVVALGDLCYTHDAYKGQAWAQLGDDVLFYKNSGIRIDLKSVRNEEPTRYRLMKDNDILAIVTDPDRIKGAVV